MIQSEIIDLAIGLIFVWFVLSLLISVINEAFALVFRIRAKHLWLGISRLLDPVNSTYSRRLWDTTVSLPMSWRQFDLRPEAQPAAADAPVKNTWLTLPDWWTKGPSGSGTAAERRSQLQASRNQLQQIYDALAPMVSDVALSGRKSKLTKINGADFAGAIAGLAKPVQTADLLAAATSLGWNDSRQAALAAAVGGVPADRVLSSSDVLALPLSGVADTAKDRLYLAASGLLTARDVADFFRTNPLLAQAITSAADAAGVGQDLSAAKATVQAWFDREMDQLSALYRRQNRKVLALLALPIVLILQANTLRIIADLRGDAALREAISSEAVAVAGASTLDAVINQQCAPAGSSGGTAANGTSGGTTDSGSGTASPSGTADGTDPFDDAVDRFACVAKIVRAAGVFAIVPDIDKITALDPSEGPFFGMSVADIWDYEFHDYGWLGRGITLVALLFGAQFWFDVLRRLVGIRKSVIGGGGSAAG